MLNPLPDMQHSILEFRKTVRRKLHHECGIIAAEQRFFEEQPKERRKDYASEIQAQHDPDLPFAEECARNKGIDRELRRTAHEWDQKDGIAFILHILHRPCSHGGRHGAAEAHEKGYEALAAQAQLPHRLIHYECYSAHIAAVLKEREQQEEYCDFGQERENAADAAQYSAADET